MNYTIKPRGIYILVSPSAIDQDTQERISTIMYTNRHDEPEIVKGKHEATIALYNFHQTCNTFKDGDTFTWLREATPFAIVEDVHVLPLYPKQSNRRQA